MQEQRKKRVGFITSSLLLKTGFSTNAKALIPHLYKTGRYEIFHLNQGIGEDPNYGRFPWHNEGVFREGTFDIGKFQADDGYKRFVSYGNCAVEKFIIDNKLDVVIHQEDIWSSTAEAYLDSKWWPYFKNNFLNHSTCDSLPVLPLFKTWAEKCPNVWLWASFGVKALHKENFEKYCHVKHVPGTLDVNEYYPISQAEKFGLRKQFGIDQDCTIFIQLGRNQLRKLFPNTMEAFAAFKKKYPEHKAKLLFHCNWSEQVGWPLERLRSEFGLAKEDILTTYFCRNCGKWEVKPFNGEDQPCPYCKSEKSQLTAGITSTVSNKDLSKIYGICDASISAYTSGGWEYTNMQSLLCQLPLLCSEYSSGEDFISNEFVYRLDGSFNYEVHTGFKKHVPNLNTMVKFFRTICEMPRSKREEIGQKGRKWCLENFSVERIGKIFEDWIDSREFITWDYKYPEYQQKNPNAIIADIPDNKEWLKMLYSEILKMSVTDQDSGLLYWESELAKGVPRNIIKDFFIKTAKGENEKNPVIIPFDNLLIKNSKKNFLIVIKESIGDIINATALFESFRKSYLSEEWNIYVASDTQYHCLYNGNPYIDKVLPYIPAMDQEILMTGQGYKKGYFDGYCLLTVATQKHLNYLTNNNIALEVKA